MNMDQQQPPESQVAANDHNRRRHYHPPPPQRKCPRCDSTNTKFCYYNNYSLSQPRYFCKACRRYWTHGGTLRNIPIGGGCRRNKRARTSSSSLSGDEIGPTDRGLSSQNLTINSAGQQSVRPLPPIRNPFFTGGAILPSLASVQPLRGGGGNQFGENMSLLQAMSLPPLRPSAPPHQFRPRIDFFPSNQSFVTSRPLNSWNQSLINASAPSSSAAGSGFWSGNTAADGGDLPRSSFSQNQWSDNHRGFNPYH